MLTACHEKGRYLHRVEGEIDRRRREIETGIALDKAARFLSGVQHLCRVYMDAEGVQSKKFVELLQASQTATSTKDTLVGNQQKVAALHSLRSMLESYPKAATLMKRHANEKFEERVSSILKWLEEIPLLPTSEPSSV